MKKVLKIVVTILFTVTILGIILSIWFLDRDLFDSGLEVLIYMIGYGDSHTNPIVRFALALIGILLVGAFSSLITVLFIEQKSKIKIDSKLNLTLSEKPNAYINVKTKHWELYDIEIRLIYSLNGATYDESIGRFPYWKSNKNNQISISLERGSVLYWYLQALYEKSKIEDLIIKVDFINGKNNQSYSAIQKYAIDSDFIINGETRFPNEKELEYICGANFELSKLKIINDTYINYSPIVKSQYCENFIDGIKAHFDLSDAPNGEFGMLMFSKPFRGNWEFFKNQGYRLAFKFYCEADVEIKLEIKSSKNPNLVTHEFETFNSLENVIIDLKDYKTEELQTITELCFTAFRREKRDFCGDFYIFDCRMEKA